MRIIAILEKSCYGYCRAMIVLFLFFGIGLLGVAMALWLPDLSDLILLAGPWTIAAFLLLLRRAVRRTKPVRDYVIVDGSNVMHWKDETPRLDTLREVLDRLKELGLTPGVVFDANAGYLLTGRYQHDLAFGRMLGLPEDQVMVVSRGHPADPAILDMARDFGARIVSNDRFRDWASDHPELTRPGHVIRGHYAAGKLVLDMHDTGLSPAGPNADQMRKSAIE